MQKQEFERITMQFQHVRSWLLIWTFAIIASGLALTILFYIQQYDREQIYLATEAAMPVHKISKTEASKWKTYKDKRHGYVIDYPANWRQGTEGSSMWFRPNVLKDSVEGPSFTINPINTLGKSVQEIFDGKSQIYININKGCKAAKIAEKDSYICSPEISFFSEKIVIVKYNNNLIFKITDPFNDDITNKILSTLKFPK